MKYESQAPSKQEQYDNIKKSTAKFAKDNPGAKIPREFKDAVPTKESSASRMNKLIAGPDSSKKRA